MSATVAVLLLQPLLLLCSGVPAAQQPTASPSPSVREYFIAAVEIGWDYIHMEEDGTASEQRRKTKEIPQKYIKAVYREYIDSTYTVPRPRPAWTGIQGPVIVAKAGDRVVVHFKNLASQPYSISPVGITYWKQSEGAGYDDSTAGQEKADDAVFPGGYYEYIWDISYKDGPTADDPECLTYSYSSQVDTVRDVNSGLIGALLICKPSAFTHDGQRKKPAFVLLFAVFDETKSWYGEVGERRSREKFKRSSSRKEYHTINGYINSTLPGLKMCQSKKHVFWHLIGVGTAPEIHSIQFQDHSLEVLTHRKVTMEVTPMTFISAEMRPATLGQFLISCQIPAHRHDGMSALFTVEKCPEPAPGPDRRKVKPEEIEGEDEDEDEDDYFLFNAISYLPKKPSVNPRSSSGQNIWKHYIAIEEITWNYSPRLKPTDSEFQSAYFPAAPHHLGYKYKKAVYVEYTDSSFTQKKNPANTLLGPPLQGKVNDQIHITLKNKASRPFNIYPNGLTKIFPLQTFVNAEKDLRSIGVPPNRTFGYVWKLTADDGPLNGDAQCLTQLYQSTVSPDRDLASGLVGTLLICKDDAIDSRGRLRGPDKEWRLVFAVLDENRSWYMDENMQHSSQSNANTTDPEFYNSNVIYSINGIMFSGRQFVICKTDVIFWHVASVGTQSDFLSVYFTGNLFQNQDLHQSVLTLFPMTGLTISMEPELAGEWEISAFDSSLRSRGMSIYYTVRPCDNGELSLVDHDWENEDISDYIDQLDLQPRGRAPQNHTMLVRVCKKPLTHNGTLLSGEHVPENETGPAGQPRCQLKRVRVTSVDGGDHATGSDEGIPQSILDDVASDGKWAVSQNGTGLEGEESVRHRRQAEGNGTDEEISSGGSEDGEIGMKNGKQAVENMADTAEEKNEIWSQNSSASGEPEESGEMLLDDHAPLSEKNSTMQQNKSTDVEPDYVQSPRERLLAELIDVDYNDTAGSNHSMGIDLSSVYDDYDQELNSTSSLFLGSFVNPRSIKVETSQYYYIAAEEITWDYGIRKPHQLISLREMRRGMRKFLPQYKKVVFRAYKDGNFIEPAGRGELQEHLGIMGPFITAEVNDQLTVVFKNKASRPYSFHLHGVYDRIQGTGNAQSRDSSAPPGVPGEPVAPDEARTYTWRVSKTQGPSDTEFACKTGAYYSTVDKERDIHSGLIGPLVICKPGTLQKPQYTQQGVQELALLFHTFDETKSWYLEENLRQYCAPPCQVNTEDPWYHDSNKFAAINGYVAETLPGLLVAQHQRVRWHLLNVGSDGEYHAVHFHSLPFTIHTKEEHRMGIYKLFPGVFGTVEMKPPTAGTWLVECTIGDYQLAGMRAKLLVYNPYCEFPLGMKSGRIEDFQITASDHIDGWEPWLARLDQSGYINAWMGTNRRSWLQVDLLRPMLLHGVKTQGVRARLRDHCITAFSVSYSLDQQTWVTYRGNNSIQSKLPEPMFYGNMDSSRVKHNHFVVPFVARYIRIHPMHYKQRPALRMELLGCDVNSCSHPLEVSPDSFSASSFYSSLLRHWTPGLARLNQEGSVNAWRPKSNNPHEWLQVDLGRVKRITGVVTQGARSLLTPMMVTEFLVTVSRDGHSWSSVTEEGSQREKTFKGNNTPEEEAMSVFEPALFGRYLRIHPRGWINDIALRMEVLGCDTQQGL